MIDAINDAMLELQSALLFRSLYPADHPLVSVREKAAGELLSVVLQSCPEISLFSLGERVVFENEVLPDSVRLSDSLFEHLRRCGVDRLTFRAGLSAEELAAFLRALAAPEGDRSLVGTSHVSFGYIDDEADDPGRDQGLDLVDTSALTRVRLPADILSQVLFELKDAGRFDLESLSGVITWVARIVAGSGGAMLPLAPLKQHDEYTFVHSINVAILSSALGEAIGFAEQEVNRLNTAALLHDVGKQEVPKEILNKKGQLTDAERARIQLHPVSGARILMQIPGVPPLASVVAYEHHAGVALVGYPTLPSGWRLSLASQIVQIADVFDALRSHRPYREGMSVDKILTIMRDEVGTLFDGELLEVFVRSVVSRGVPDSYPAEKTVAEERSG